MKPSHAVFLLAVLAASPLPAGQDRARPKPAAPQGRTPADDAEGVSLRDGSFLKGQVLGLENNVLKFQTKDAGVLEINWAHVNALRSDGALTFVMNDGEIITGSARPGDLLGSLWVLPAGGDPSSPMKGEERSPVSIPIRLVREINPPPNAIKAKGALTLGASVQDGNTQVKSFSFVWDAEVRNRLNRLGTIGTWNYAEENGEVQAKRFATEVQYDRFILNRVYGYGGARFEKDPFQDIDLRSVLNLGVGYQAVQEGDLPNYYFNGPLLKGIQWLNNLDLRGEGGLSYFIDNYYDAPNRSYLSGRWSVKMRWPVHERIAIFHTHQGYPSLEDAENLFISTQQGVRLQVVKGFGVSLQVNWDWHNKPSPGFERNDFVFIIGIGYNFDLRE